jgi:hypothetical protein
MSDCPQSDPGTFPSCAIGEVAFNQTGIPPVPVPGAFPLLALALGTLGGVAVRRRRRA